MERFALTTDLTTIHRVEWFDKHPGPVGKGWRWLPEGEPVTVDPDAERRLVVDVPGDPSYFYEEVPAESLEQRRINVLSELEAERTRTLIEDGVTFTAAAATAKYRLSFIDQQNINAVGVDASDPDFNGVTKTSIDMGEVSLTAEECNELARAARKRVIQVIDWYKSQKTAVETSDNPESLTPFSAPPEGA